MEKIHSQIQSLKDFTANASHELKTPLMMMNTEIDLAMKKQDAVERLPKIKQSLKRISALLDILTLITKLESGVKLEKEEVSLKDLAEENIEVIKDRIKQSTGEKKLSQGKISLTVTPPLTDVTVKANPALLSIVFKNLIENALTHAGPEVKVSVILDQHSFSVEDTGVGIAPDIQDKIFERFYQAEKSEDKANHSFGLGLYLVKKIVELHGWKLTVKSEVGKGSTFTIKF
ncbi:HAMP domain-containing histidine kinase [bacterium]|nr:HAMP domain-containing histidine kinase [bacterium]